MRVQVRAEITGSVYQVSVEVGQSVREEETLIVLESMKMEIPIVAPEDGVVKEILVKAGDVIAEGDVAVILEAQ